MAEDIMHTAKRISRVIIMPEKILPCQRQGITICLNMNRICPIHTEQGQNYCNLPQLIENLPKNPKKTLLCLVFAHSPRIAANYAYR
jgi:hypothetical protein